MAKSKAEATEASWFTPVASFVAVEQVDREAVTQGGILIPETAMARECVVGLVRAAGPEVKQATAGKRVLCFAGSLARSVRYKGSQLLIIKEADLVGVLPD